MLSSQPLHFNFALRTNKPIFFIQLFVSIIPDCAAGTYCQIAAITRPMCRLRGVIMAKNFHALMDRTPSKPTFFSCEHNAHPGRPCRVSANPILAKLLRSIWFRKFYPRHRLDQVKCIRYHLVFHQWQPHKPRHPGGFRSTFGFLPARQP